MSGNHPKPITNIAEDKIKLFWSHVDIRAESECWPWKGHKERDGYGSFRIERGHDRTERKAHRVAFFLSNGHDSKYLVCHSCDNPPCCNPKHLFEGTHKDNAIDAKTKGRRRYNTESKCVGEDNPKAKLTTDQVIEIRKRHQQGGISKRQLAREYNISAFAIYAIIKRLSWSHIACDCNHLESPRGVA